MAAGSVMGGDDMRDGLTPARRLDVEGARNVRELGGYKTADGRTTRWRTFLRADSLHELSPGSQSALVDYGIRTVVDLRTSVEVQERPNVFSRSSEVAYHHHNLLGDEPLAGVGDTVETDTGSANIARDYTLWLDHLQPRFSGALAILAERGARPAMFHCAGGKDRTGLVSALLLGLAGVPAATIAEDYAFSARFLIARSYAAEPELEASGYTWQDYQRQYCPPDGMLAVLGHLDERYGGVEGYVRAIGLDREQIDTLRNALV